MLKKKAKVAIIGYIIINIVFVTIFLYLLYRPEPRESDKNDIIDYYLGEPPEEESNIYLIKYDSDGNVIWKITFGMTSVDQGHDITVDKDNDTIIVGEINGGVGIYQDVILIKFNSTGTQLWNTTWGGINHEFGKGIVTDNESNIYITGTTDGYGSGENDAFIVKFNSIGIQLWNMTWGGIYDEFANDIIIDNETNIYITGRTESSMGQFDAFIAKFNGTNGDQIWNITWGGSNIDEGTGLVFDNKTNIYLVGRTLSFGAGNTDVVIAKYYLNGTKIWNYTWGYSNSEVGYDITIDSSTNVYITGYLFNYETVKEDVIIIKYNSEGFQMWNTTWGGSGYEEGKSIAVDNNGDIYITGFSGNYYYVLKYNSTGSQIWALNPGDFEYFIGNGISIDNANNIYITGLTHI